MGCYFTLKCRVGELDFTIKRIGSSHERETERTEIIFYQHSFYAAVQFPFSKNGQQC